MYEPWRNPDVVAEHVAILAQRSLDDGDLLVASLFASCWPGGCEDRHDPIAIEWLRHRPPVRVDGTGRHCTCDRGRCSLCN